jgi:hypothetical protein
MTQSWQQFQAEMEAEVQHLFKVCPDEIKRFHYGLITHSDAGKHALNQFFGHQVHVYAGYYGYLAQIGGMIQLAHDPEMSLGDVKKVFQAIIMSSSPIFAEYGGQVIQGKYSAGLEAVWDSCDVREDLIGLLETYAALISRLYWWFHWYFPWGAGPVISRRVSAEDVQEMQRLLDSTPSQG